MEGLGHTLARKFCSNSLASWSKDETENWHSRLNHARAGPLKVVGNAWHISASKVP